mgnify:FL=1
MTDAHLGSEFGFHTNRVALRRSAQFRLGPSSAEIVAVGRPSLRCDYRA